MSPGLAQLEQEILSWPRVTMRPHQFNAHEFRYNDAEIGHLHAWGVLDVPYPRAIRDALLDEKLAEEHEFVPNSGWTTVHIRDANDVPTRAMAHAAPLAAPCVESGPCSAGTFEARGRA